MKGWRDGRVEGWKGGGMEECPRAELALVTHVGLRTNALRLSSLDVVDDVEVVLGVDGSGA